MILSWIKSLGESLSKVFQLNIWLPIELNCFHDWQLVFFDQVHKIPGSLISRCNFLNFLIKKIFFSFFDCLFKSLTVWNWIDANSSTILSSNILLGMLIVSIVPIVFLSSLMKFFSFSLFLMIVLYLSSMNFLLIITLIIKEAWPERTL